MDKDDQASIDYSQLNKGEIKNIQDVEDKINKDRTEPVILLAVDHKESTK